MRTPVTVCAIILIIALSGAPPFIVRSNYGSCDESFCGTQESIASIIETNIERYRKGNVTLTIVDSQGTPVRVAEVEIRQLNHDFLFGCAYPLEVDIPIWVRDRYQSYFASLFNYATTENAFKWYVLSRQGYGQIDRMLEWTQSHSIKVKGHNLVWGNIPGSGSGVPVFLRTASRDEVRLALQERIREAVSKYAGRIDIWDVVNEPFHAKWFDEHFGEDYVEKSLEWSREANPNATLLVNETGILRDVQITQEYLDYLGKLEAKGVPLDVVGVQAHSANTWFSPEQIYDALDTLASLGLDIHITEFSVLAAGQPIEGGFRSGVWDEQAQAEYFEMFYRTAFSHPNVKAITLWDLWDGSSMQPPMSGILRSDFTTKPAYRVLDRLINTEWRTSVTTHTNGEGKVEFRGFYGRYQIVVTNNGQRLTGAFHLAENGTMSQEVAVSPGVETPKSSQTLPNWAPTNWSYVAGLIIIATASLIFLRKFRPRSKPVAK